MSLSLISRWKARYLLQNWHCNIGFGYPDRPETRESLEIPDPYPKFELFCQNQLETGYAKTSKNTILTGSSHCLRRYSISD